MRKNPMTDRARSDSTRRGRPSLARVAAIDRSILEAAGELFLRDGFDAVTMERIAAGASISKTTLYSRFSSKELIFEQVVRDRIDQWAVLASTQDHLMTDDIEDRMRYHACTIARMMRRPDVQAFIRLALANAERFPSISNAMHEGYLYIVDFVRRDIEEVGKREGRQLRDGAGVARHFVSAVSGWVIQEGGRPDITESEVEAAAIRSAELVLAARDCW